MMDWFMITLAALLAAGLVAVAVTLEIQALARASRVEDEQRFPRVLQSKDAAASKNVRTSAPKNDSNAHSYEAQGSRS